MFLLPNILKLKNIVLWSHYRTKYRLKCLKCWQQQYNSAIQLHICIYSVVLSEVENKYFILVEHVTTSLD